MDICSKTFLRGPALSHTQLSSQVVLVQCRIIRKAQFPMLGFSLFIFNGIMKILLYIWLFLYGLGLTCIGLLMPVT